MPRSAIAFNQEATARRDTSLVHMAESDVVKTAPTAPETIFVQVAAKPEDNTPRSQASTTPSEHYMDPQIGFHATESGSLFIPGGLHLRMYT